MLLAHKIELRPTVAQADYLRICRVGMAHQAVAETMIKASCNAECQIWKMLEQGVR